MEASLEFLGSGGKTTLKSSYSKTVSRDVQSTYSVDFAIENHTDCTADGKEGAGLYQWVVSTEDMMN